MPLKRDLRSKYSDKSHWTSGNLLIVVVIATLVLTGCEPVPGKMIDSQEFANNSFKVRVQIYDEGNKAHIFERGCHLQLASAKLSSNEWNQFSTAYYSKCDEIPRDRVRFVNDKTAYVFMQWWFKVTTDGGIKWSSWNVPGHLPDRVYYSPRLIQDVSMNSDGRGTMTLNPEGVRNKEQLTLYTHDFGLHWNLE
jgi:hypothetical protein